MVRTTLAIGRGVDDAHSIQDMGANTKRKENQSSSNSRRKRKTSILIIREESGRLLFF